MSCFFGKSQELSEYPNENALALVRFLNSGSGALVVEDSLPYYLNTVRFEPLIVQEKLLLDANLAEGNKINALANFENLAEISLRAGRGSENKDYLLRALRLAEELDLTDKRAWINAKLGHNTRLGDVQSTYKQYYIEALELFARMDDPLSKAESSYINALLSESDDNAVGFLEEGIKLLENEKDSQYQFEASSETLAKLQNSLAYYVKDPKRKLEAYLAAIAAAETAKDSIALSFYYNNAGFVYFKAGQYDASLPWYFKALNVSLGASFKGLVRNSLNNIANSYRGLNQWKTAFEYNEASSYLTTSIVNDSFDEQMLQNRVTYELDKSELEKNLLLKDQLLKRRQNLILLLISALLLALILLAAFAIWKIRRSNALLEQQAKKLKELDQVKSRFFANISHELKTPLSLIMAPVQGLLEELDGDNPTREKLEIVQRNSGHLHELINEILDLARLEAGKLTVTLNPLDLIDTIKEALSSYQWQLSENKVNLEIKNEMNLNSCMLDEKKFLKVFNNLMSNAVKYTPTGGKIRITIKNSNQGQLSISVFNTGEVIPSEDLLYIFNRYFQSNIASKKAEGGTGIGLALAKELTELMGGTLSVKNHPGLGVEFSIVLPLTKLTEISIPTAEIETRPIGQPVLSLDIVDVLSRYQSTFKVEKPVLLLAEDHPEMRQFIAEMMKEHFEVIEARNGKEAYQLLQKYPIDMVISDVMMPVMDGFELLSQIKSDVELRNLSIIMLTARSDEEDKLTGLNMGIDDYITKPFSKVELMARVRNILENRIKVMSAQSDNKDTSKEQLDLKEALTVKYYLSERELDVFFLMQERLSNSEISDKLFVSVSTVKFHLHNIFSKLFVKNRKEAIKKAESLTEVSKS
ncbi:MAG: signal transduction histidine kinase/DNA-binding NarL/FixJ family response regulator [Marinoscillum sp.]